MRKILQTFSLFLLIAVFASVSNSVFAKPNPSVNEKRKEIKENKEDLQTKLKNLQNQFKNRFAKLLNVQIKAINGPVLSVTQNGKTYTINTGSSTKLRRHFWGGSSISEMSVGDKLNIWGAWTDDSHTTMDARLIKDLSIVKVNGTLMGQINAKNSDNLVIKTKKATITVYFGSSTKFVNKKNSSISISDVSVNDRVRVKGVWDRTNNKVTEVKEIRDFNR